MTNPFLRLAAEFLAVRLYIVQGKPGEHGALLGMKDISREMRLLVEEMKKGQK